VQVDETGELDLVQHIHGKPSRNERERAQSDIGQATMAMLIAAADFGIGSGHSAVADQEIEKRLQRAWVQPVVETLGAAPSKPRLVLAIASDAQGGPRTSLVLPRAGERRRGDQGSPRRSIRTTSRVIAFASGPDHDLRVLWRPCSRAGWLAPLRHEASETWIWRWLSDKHDGPRIFVKVCQRPLARPNQIAHDKALPGVHEASCDVGLRSEAAALSRLANGLGLPDSHGEEQVGCPGKRGTRFAGHTQL
jgi:hypothetical protein